MKNVNWETFKQKVEIETEKTETLEQINEHETDQKTKPIVCSTGNNNGKTDSYEEPTSNSKNN